MVPVLIILAIAGLIYLFKKNYKLAACFVLLVISNLLIMSQFIGWAAENHVLDTMIIISILIGFGFMLVFDMIMLLINKIPGNGNNGSYVKEGETDSRLKTRQKIEGSSAAYISLGGECGSSGTYKSSGEYLSETDKNNTEVKAPASSMENISSGPAKSPRPTAVKHLILAVFLAATFVFPVLLATGNYKSADLVKTRRDLSLLG